MDKHKDDHKHLDSEHKSKFIHNNREYVTAETIHVFLYLCLQIVFI